MANCTFWGRNHNCIWHILQTGCNISQVYSDAVFSRLPENFEVKVSHLVLYNYSFQKLNCWNSTPWDKTCLNNLKKELFMNLVKLWEALYPVCWMWLYTIVGYLYISVDDIMLAFDIFYIYLVFWFLPWALIPTENPSVLVEFQLPLYSPSWIFPWMSTDFWKSVLYHSQVKIEKPIMQVFSFQPKRGNKLAVLGL